MGCGAALEVVDGVGLGGVAALVGPLAEAAAGVLALDVVAMADVPPACSDGCAAVQPATASSETATPAGSTRRSFIT